MKVRYKDGPSSVTVAGVDGIVGRGETVEIEDEIAKQLLAQGWEQAGKSAEKKEKD